MEIIIQYIRIQTCTNDIWNLIPFGVWNTDTSFAALVVSSQIRRRPLIPSGCPTRMEPCRNSTMQAAKDGWVGMERDTLYRDSQSISVHCRWFVDVCQISRNTHIHEKVHQAKTRRRWSFCVETWKQVMIGGQGDKSNRPVTCWILRIGVVPFRERGDFEGNTKPSLIFAAMSWASLFLVHEFPTKACRNHCPNSWNENGIQCKTQTSQVSQTILPPLLETWNLKVLHNWSCWGLPGNMSNPSFGYVELRRGVRVVCHLSEFPKWLSTPWQVFVQ